MDKGTEEKLKVWVTNGLRIIFGGVGIWALGDFWTVLGVIFLIYALGFDPDEEE